jgi:hypothetical protein
MNKIYKYPFRELLKEVRKKGPIKILFMGTKDSMFLPKKWTKGKLGRVKLGGAFWSRGDYLIEKYNNNKLVGYQNLTRNMLIKKA